MGRRAALLVLVFGLGACRSTAEAPDAAVDPSARPQAPTDGARRAVIDAHIHVAPTEIDRLHRILDAAGVDWALNLSGLWPGGPLETQLRAARRSGRLLVACNLPWPLARRLDNFPELSAELLTRAKALGARALKVEKALGLTVHKKDGTLLAVDDPWLDPIWRRAGELGLPVVIHTADPKAFWLPMNDNNERIEELRAHPSWSNHQRGVPTFDTLLGQLMRVVARHPKTTFVSVHFGNNAEDPWWVGRMLDRHPNLYVDLAARIVELGRHEPERLRQLFMRHRRRILFGSDLGVSPGAFLMLGSFGETPNRFEEVAPFFAAHYRWLETKDTLPSPTPIQGRWPIRGLGLPPEVTRHLYRDNALRLFGPAPEPSAEGH